MAYTLMRGIALGLWILAGLAFLTSALLPGSAVALALGPLLLAGAVGWTTLMPQRKIAEAYQRRKEGSYSSVLLRLYAPALCGALAAGVIALVVVRAGDQRSFIFSAFAALCALALGWQPHSFRRDG